MAQFKNGQKVIRTADDYDHVKKGFIYTVSHQNEYTLYLVEIGGKYDSLLFQSVNTPLDNSAPMEFLN